MADPSPKAPSGREIPATASSGRNVSGEIREHTTKSGVVTYSIRVRWRGQRLNVRLGNELEGWNRRLAEVKLEETSVAIAAGTWRPPVPDIPDEERDPVFHEFATVWFDRHRADLDDSTVESYSHILSRYILPEFKALRLSEITYEAVRRWRDALRAESEQLKLAKEHQVTLLDRRGRAKRPFGPQTINQALRLLGQVLARAVESEQYVLERNPVAGRSGLRMKTPGRPPREHLEADEVLSLIEAADLVDQGVAPRTLERGARARELRERGLIWADVAEAMGCTQSTAIYLSGVRPRLGGPRRRRAMIIVLALTGVRASEHTQLTWADVDHTHGRIVVGDAKTPAGVREIYLSAFVREELALYKASLPTPPARTDPVFAVRGGGTGDRFNLARRLKHIAQIAADMRARADLAPMPARITPHTFRRTFITLSFQAGKDLVFVQSQAGHADWKTTLAIYTQQSGRSVDPSIRQLLTQFLGEHGVFVRVTHTGPSSIDLHPERRQ
jgi:integrase